MKVFKSQKGSVVKHIQHPHSAEMATKSDVIVRDVLHKNETKRVDMIDIMMASQEFLGKDYPHRIPSGGDLLIVVDSRGNREQNDISQMLTHLRRDWIV